MAEHLTWWEGDRLPVIGDTLTIDGVPVDLSTKTVKFRMRPVGGTALVVDADASSAEATGEWTYAWEPGDLDEEGEYLVWLDVLTSGLAQTQWESLIEVRSHGSTIYYAEPEQLKSALELTSTTFADTDIATAIRAASRAVDSICGRRFFKDPTNQSKRVFTPASGSLCPIDDLIECVKVEIDRDGSGTYGETWATSDYMFEPPNAAADGKPWEWLRTKNYPARYFPTYHQAVRVTGRFGWESVPDDVYEATKLIATQVFKRNREAPFGVVTIGIEIGAAMRIARKDPHVVLLLDGYTRERPLC